MWLTVLIYRSDGSSGEATKNDDPESHQNEGFLKSMWHNLTNHPAHQKPEENASSGSDQKKPEDPPKKESGSGSG